MARHLFIAFLSLVLLSSCSPSPTQRAAEITKLETELKESSKKNIADTTKVKQLLQQYALYAQAFPTDSLTPGYLMKSAKFFDYLLLTDSAIHVYDRVYTQFPTYAKADVALFSEAFIYNNEKHNMPKAKKLYEEYIAKYPNTSLSRSAAMELHNLGKTPEQIMAELDSMKQANAASPAQ